MKEYGIMMKDYEFLWRGPWHENAVDNWLAEALEEDPGAGDFFTKVERNVSEWREWKQPVDHSAS